jgi:rod shape-determining protein MreD
VTRPFLFLGLGALALLLQATIVPALPFGDLHPDLVLILLIYLAGRSDAMAGGAVAFALGYGMDILSGSPFGTFTVTKVLVFFAAYLAAKRVYLTAGLAPAAATVVFTIFEALVIRVLYRVLGLDASGLEHGLLRYVVFQAILMGVLALFAFHNLARFDAWLVKRFPGLDERRQASLVRD